MAWLTSRSCRLLNTGRATSATSAMPSSSRPCRWKKSSAGTPFAMSTMRPMKPNSDTSTMATMKPTTMAAANTGHTWRR